MPPKRGDPSAQNGGLQTALMQEPGARPGCPVAQSSLLLIVAATLCALAAGVAHETPFLRAVPVVPRCDEAHGLARVYGRALRSMGAAPSGVWDSEVEARAGTGCRAYSIPGEVALSQAARMPHLDGALAHLARPCLAVQVCVIEVETACAAYRFVTLGPPEPGPPRDALAFRPPVHEQDKEACDAHTCADAVRRHASAARAANLSAPLHVGACDDLRADEGCDCAGLAGPVVWHARVSPGGRKQKARRVRRPATE